MDSRLRIAESYLEDVFFLKTDSQLAVGLLEWMNLRKSRKPDSGGHPDAFPHLAAAAALLDACMGQD